MLLLDTNAISELRKVHHRRTDAKFVAWSKGLRWSELYLSVITIYELEVGMVRVERYDPEQGQVLRSWYHRKVMPRFASRILPIHAEIASRAAELQRSRTRQVEDTFIAATAEFHRLKLVTRNVAHFKDIGIEIINPWDAV